MLGFLTGVGRRVQETCRWNGRNGYGRIFNNRFFPLCLFFVITEVYEGTGACGKHRDGCGDPRRIRKWYLFLTYTPVSPVRLIFWLDDEMGESERAKEQSIGGKNLRSISFLQSVKSSK